MSEGIGCDKMSALARVEQAILDILAGYQGEEVSGRALRRLLTNRGFRRSAPAFIFTMMALADKGLVKCREEVFVIGGLEARDRYYQLIEGPRANEAVIPSG